MKHPLRFLLLLPLCVLALANLPAQAAETPNIIIILADDQGFGDVSALNPESKIPTPHVDRLAKEGMAFTDGHTSSSVCTPTRYSLLTGRYHWRSRLQRGVLGGFSRPLITPDTLTIAGLLKQKGYHTACVGKWHLGMDWPLKGGGYADDQGNFGKIADFPDAWNVDYEKPIANGPTARGFDYYFGISASLDMFPYVYIENDHATQPATVEKAFHRPGPAAEDFEAVDVLPRLTDVVLDYIGERAADAKAGKPFFLYFPLNAPHTPIVPTEEWVGKSGINIYADFVLQVDETVRQVLEALDKNELTNDTLIVFTTDNGCSPAAKINELQAAGHEPSYIYRGHKADIFDGGHRVPFLVRWPGHVAPGTRSAQLVSQVDLMATAADIVGVPLPENAGVDSVSILSAMLGTDKEPIREALVHQSINGAFAIRQGDWKLNLCPGSGGWSSPRPGREDLSGLPKYQLYNMADDPGETNNLQAEHPDIVANLEGLLRTYIDRGRSTPGPDQENEVPVEMVKPIAKAPAKKLKDP